MEKLIKEIATSLDIELIGFSELEYDQEYRDRLKQKEQTNKLFPRLRSEARDVLNNAKSVISLGVSYYHDDKFKLNDDEGYVCMSARGLDYHQVCRELASLLCKKIKETVPDFEYFIQVDNGPLDDRYYAYKAGLGYFGKNSCLINPIYGSFIVFTTIVTNKTLKPSSVLDNDCGECNNCLKYCPNHALEPYILDYTRCLSNITQSKNTAYLRLNKRLFGCDTCQLVCPKNMDIKKTLHSSFLINRKIGYNCIDILNMTKKEYKINFKDCAWSWVNKNIIDQNCLKILMENDCFKPFLDAYQLKLIKNNNNHLLELLQRREHND